MRAMQCPAIFLIALLSIVKLSESRASSLRVLEGPDVSRDNGVPVLRTLQTTGGGEEQYHEEGEEENHDDEDGHDHEAEDGHEDHTDELHDEDHDGDHEGHDHGDEAIVSSSASENSSEPWGPAIGYAFLVNLATLVGVLVLVPTMMGGCSFARSFDDKASKRVRYFVYILIPSFAAGALLATSVFLLIPESVLLIGNATGAAEHDHRRHLQEANAEGQLAWKFGASFLGGFLIPIFMGSIFPHAHEVEVAQDEVAQDEVAQDDCPLCEDRDSRVLFNLNNMDQAVPMITCHASLSTCDEGACNKDSHGREVEDEEEVWDGGSCLTSNDNNASAVTAVPEQAVPVKDATSAKGIEPKGKIINYRLATSLFLGDFFHNFADGIFLGTAFKLCERSVAIAVAVATIYHELAQELADYFLLTEHCGLSPIKALILNFLNGLSVVIGVILILALDVSNMATGCILAVSAGVYAHVAASECIPRIEKELKTFKDRAISILCFFLGAVPIGLVLLNHGHCTG